MKKFLFAVLTAGLFTACTQENGFELTPQANDHITVNAQIQRFAPAAETRTVINPADYSCTWKTGDKIGMFSNHIDGETQTPSQLGLSLYSGNGTGEAIFTGSTGWKMNANGEYNYVAYYPNGEKNTRECVTLDYSGQIQTADNSTAHLGDYDFMYSTAKMPTNADEISFSFSHINAITNLHLTLPEAYKDRKFSKVCLMSEDDIFTTTATYDIQSLISNGVPTITTTQMSNRIEMEFAGEGISGTNGVLDAWIMMMPIQWNGKEITIQLYDRYSAFPFLEGTFMPDTNQQSATIYSYNIVLSKSSPLPDKPEAGKNLNILLLGHSFGVDATEYIPRLLQEAGITNVNLGRFYYGGCSLQEYWNFWITESSIAYHYCTPGNVTWSNTSKTIQQVLDDTPWDLIVYQTATGSCGGADYTTYQPYLNDLLRETLDYATQKHGKTPYVAWHMFWSHNRNHSYTEDIDIESLYTELVATTKTMMAETGIKVIIPTGTAVQNARQFHTDISKYTFLLRDGYHICYGVGRYVTACTWFQTIIAPIYDINVLGNTLRMPDRISESQGKTGLFLPVKDEDVPADAILLQKCAVEAAKHPFEVTKIEE